MTREQQEREIKTIKSRKVIINLSDADCDRLTKVCGQHGLTVGELIENFIGDLVGGTHSNGSDERDYADAWLESCFKYPEETLLKWLIDNLSIDVEEFLDLIDNIEIAKIDLEEYEKDPSGWDEEAIEFLKIDLEEWEEELADYKSLYMEESPEADWENEIEKVKNWFDQSEEFKEEVKQPDEKEKKEDIQIQPGRI